MSIRPTDYRRRTGSWEWVDFPGFLDTAQFEAILATCGARGVAIKQGVAALNRDARALWSQLLKEEDDELVIDQIAGIVDDIVSRKPPS